MKLDDPEMRATLTSVSQLRIVFGHQSVGDNILAGFKNLFDRAGSRGPRIVRADEEFSLAGGVFAHGIIGRNREPATKCSAWLDLLGRFEADSIDVTLMKFCYVDMTPETDVQALLNAYSTAVDRVRSLYPGVTIVHVTVPLSARKSGLKQFVKRAIGRQDENDLANLKREEYNNLLRARYESEPIFDLAMAEATAPDGSVAQFEAGGRRGLSLFEGYTEDGGHLNQIGAVHVALELARVLGEVARARGLQGI